MSDRLAELNMLTNHHDRHWMQMEMAHAEGRISDAEYHRLEMGHGEERALEIEHQLQDEYRDQSNRDLMARYAARDGFTIGQRVRFIEFPSLVCTVTATGTDPETGQSRYQLAGREGPLGCWYVRDDLEAI